MNIQFDNPFPKDGFTGKEDYDGLRLEVFGQYQCQQYIPKDYEVCISITSEGHGIAAPNLGTKFYDLLTVKFDDVVVAADGTTITSEQAEKIAKFVMKHRDKKKIVVHCFAGMHRSRSTAAAIAKVLGLPFSYTALNRSVYQAMMGALEKEMENKT